MKFRSPTGDELRLLVALSKLANIDEPDAWARGLKVRDMNDGGMGSLELQATEPRRPGPIVCLAAVQFTDSDGVEVIASLNATDNGVPFEVDVWKTDYSALRCIPQDFRPLPPE